MEKALAGKYWSPLIFDKGGKYFDDITNVLDTKVIKKDIGLDELMQSLGNRGIIFLDLIDDAGHYINYMKKTDGSMIFLDAQWNKSFNSFSRFTRQPSNGKFGLIRTK